MGFDSWSFRDKIIMTWSLIIASVAVIFVCVSLGNLISDNSSNIAAWVQAVGSIAAIVFTALGTRWQIGKSRKLQEEADVMHNIQMCNVCIEMCNAVISIMQSKHNILEKKNTISYSDYSPSLNSLLQSEWREFLSLERIEDLQGVMRALLWKNMPSQLLRSLFSLQKLTVQYKEFVIGYIDSSKTVHIKGIDLKIQSKKKFKEINSEVSKISKNIKDFEQLLKLNLSKNRFCDVEASQAH